MLKRSLLVLSVVGLMAGAVVAQPEVEFSYDTGLRDSGNPALSAPGVPTPLVISVVNNTETDFAIGGVVFSFSGDDFNWDLLGPDGLPSTPDDGFMWEEWLDGSPHPVFATPAYFPTIDPPQTALTLTDIFAVTVPALSSTPVATLMISGKAEGKFDFVAGDEAEILAAGEARGFENVPVGGTNTVGVTVLPEPATLGLLGLGGLMFLRRRR